MQKNKEIIKSGDILCKDCGTEDNIVWFTDDVFWNSVIKNIWSRGIILCVNCFVKRAEKKFDIVSWRLIPSWRWKRIKHK